MPQENQSDNLTASQMNVASHPESIEDLFALADAYADRNSWDDAISTYTIAMTLAPTNSDLHNSLGTVYAEAGKPEEAEKAYRQAIASRSKNSMAYSNLGALYEEQHRWSEAIQAFEKCLQYSTDDGERSLSYARMLSRIEECRILSRRLPCSVSDRIQSKWVTGF